MRNLITGGAGFVGSHLCEKLVNKGEYVVCLDNFLTGNKNNIIHLQKNKNFKLIEKDVRESFSLDVDRIWHLACPASPFQYQKDPIETALILSEGTKNMLQLAAQKKAKFLLASSSEIYGNPLIHPQCEKYNGNVNPIGKRSCYDEGKRFAESLTFDFIRVHKIDACIARIFNFYGPKLSLNDGRVISNFIIQAIRNEKLTVYGDGNQTRSFGYIDDLINGLYKFMNSDEIGPINIANDEEYSIIELAHIIREKVNPKLEIIHLPLPEDDPTNRKADIKLAKEKLNWYPSVKLLEGIDRTIEYFRELI